MDCRRAFCVVNHGLGSSLMSLPGRCRCCEFRRTSCQADPIRSMTARTVSKARGRNSVIIAAAVNSGSAHL